MPRFSHVPLRALCALIILISLINGHPHFRDETKSSHKHIIRHHHSHRHRISDTDLPLIDFSQYQADSTNVHARNTDDATIQRLTHSIMQSRDGVFDFERGRQMDVNDETVRHTVASSGPADNETLRMYAELNCTSCLLREEAKLNRIERIKEDLLNKLGFKREPNTTSQQGLPSIPNLSGILSKWGFPSGDTMTADQAMAADQPYDHSGLSLIDKVKTERVFTFATKPPMVFGLPDDLMDSAAYFRFSNEIMINDVNSASLNVHINRPTSLSSDAMVVLHLKMDVFVIDSLDGELTLIHSKRFKRNYKRPTAHWEEVDVTKHVRHWFQKPERNFGFFIRVMYEDENLANVPTMHTIQGENQIYLDIITQNGANRRSKREIVKLDCTEGDNESRCCRYPLVLDFESFGWDWVIAPKKYLAYYCSGECPFHHLQRYAHTHFVQQANPKGNVGPCCHPTEMAPILMVYFGQNKEVLVSKVPGMVVVRCGCA